MHPEKKTKNKKSPLKFDERASVLAETLNKESDRGRAVLGAEIISVSLESLLRTFFRADLKTVDPLFKGFGPLSSFAAKIQMAYVMHLIPKIIKDRLELIRKLRNQFAHCQTPLDFSDSQCTEILHILANGKFEPEILIQEIKHKTLRNKKVSEKSLETAFILYVPLLKQQQSLS